MDQKPFSQGQSDLNPSESKALNTAVKRDRQPRKNKKGQQRDSNKDKSAKGIDNAREMERDAEYRYIYNFKFATMNIFEGD